MLFGFKKINNESGIVLFIVLMTAIIIMIFSVGILTQSANEINYAQQQIDQIASEEMGKGVFWQQYSSIGSYNTLSSVPATAQTMNNRIYQILLVQGSTSSGVVSYNAVVNYNAVN
jgi:hypothetical protein